MSRLDEEIRAHLELLEREHRARGLSPQEARDAARRDFGGVAPMKERYRDQRGRRWIDELIQDVRYGARSLRRTPGFTAVAVLTLALGIGATTAVFSVVNAVLIQPLRYPEPDALVAVSHTAVFQGVNIDTFPFNSQMYVAYVDANRTFQEFGVWSSGSGNVTGMGEPHQVQTLVATHGVLPALGVQPALGRWFSEADDAPGGPGTAILSHAYWRSRFGEDRGVIGRSITIDARPRAVIGVMPESFRFLDVAPDVVLPKRFDRSQLSLGGFGNRGIARLRPGVTLQQADADVARMVRIWLDSLVQGKQAMEALRLGPAVRPLKGAVVGDIGNLLWVLMGTVGIVLAIACANVANLLLVRAETHHQEIAIRAALGAGWRRIARGLLVQSAMLGLLGGATGLAFAYAGLRLLVAMAPANLPRLTEIAIDPLVLGCALALSLLCGLFFGVVPVVKHATPRLTTALFRGAGRAVTQSRERRRSQDTLVVVQVALALVLLVAAGLMIRSVQAMRNVDPGFSGAGQVQTVRVGIPQTDAVTPERLLQMQQQIVDRFAATPGVTLASFTTALPMETEPEFESGTTVSVEGTIYGPGENPPFRRVKWVSPDFFGTVGTRLIAGRDFTWTDLHERRDVVVISENMARETWGSAAAALRKRVREGVTGPLSEVIGVVADVHDDGAHRPAPAIVYWPARAQPSVAFALRVERAGSEGLLREVQQAVRDVNPNVPLARVWTLDAFYDRSMARTSFTLTMLGIAGSMALLLGIIGIYGVLAYTVTQRTPEIGVRIALGANPRAVKGMFIRHGLLLSGVGIALGLAAAAGLSGVMSALLFGVTPHDPATYALTASVLLAMMLLASYIPANRAATMDPIEAIRGHNA